MTLYNSRPESREDFVNPFCSSHIGGRRKASTTWDSKYTVLPGVDKRYVKWRKTCSPKA